MRGVFSVLQSRRSGSECFRVARAPEPRQWPDPPAGFCFPGVPQPPGFASSQGWHGLSPPRAAGFPHPQPSTEGLAGPWGNPESF